jgi:hypothetical protein
LGSFYDVPYQVRFTGIKPDIIDSYAKVISGVCTPRVADPLGAVSNGFLNLEGLLLPVGMADPAAGEAGKML